MVELTAYEELTDYRRKVAAMYALVRRPLASAQAEDEHTRELKARWRRFRRSRDLLFASHPQGALDQAQKAVFTGLPYYPYDPGLRFAVRVERDVEPNVIEVDLPEDGVVRLKRFGRIRFAVQSQAVTLYLYWIQGYGGGIFLPFRDRTNGAETYGGGRYLLDTIKHADLGQEDGLLVVDFNYAYNPSCAYNARWHCPLALAENWLPAPIRAGELRFPHAV
ncbi:MAG: DUF1684 domain-containing protein [Anaerolineae bacterium]